MVSKVPGPFRTCVGCGAKKGKDELLRFTAGFDRSLVLELRGGGRGAYLCPRMECLELAIKQRGFQRTLKTDLAAINKERILEEVKREMGRKIQGLLGLAQRARRLAIGTDAVAETLKRGEARAVLLACDTPSKTKHRFLQLCQERGFPILEVFDRAGLGQIFGRNKLTVVTIKDASFAEGIIRYSQKLIR